MFMSELALSALFEYGHYKYLTLSVRVWTLYSQILTSKVGLMSVKCESLDSDRL